MKQTNKYIKYIKRLSIMIVTMLLSFTIITQDVHAIEIGNNDYSIRDYYLLASNTNITTQTYEGGDQIIGGILYYLDSLSDVHHIQFELNADPNYLSSFRYLYFAYDSFNDPFDSDFNVLYVNISGDNFLSNYDTLSDVRYWGSEYTTSGFTPNTVLYDDETYLGSLFSVGQYTSKIYVSFIVESDDLNDVNDVQAYLLNYLTKQIYITNRTALNILNSSFISGDIEDAYNQGYDDASDHFMTNIIPAEKTASYNQARAFYGIYYNEQWWPAVNWGNIRFDEGFEAGEYEGMLTSQQEAYEKGFIDGSNDSFLANIKDWIVPAIIVVLFLGGAVSVVLRKREG